VDELVIAQPIKLGGCADAHNPQRAVLPLALLASGIGELEAAFYGLFCGAVKFGFSKEVAACAV